VVDSNPRHFTVLHQNIQSMRNKLLDIDLVLKAREKNIDVLCLTEHWVQEDYLTTIQIDQYKLVSYFGRKTHKHGGSCIYVKKSILTRDVHYLGGISVEKDFEMSVVEVVTYGYIIVCIYRSPDGNYIQFLKNLELVIQKIQSKRKKLLLCGDWNLNFLVDNIRIQELENLLESYDLINTVRSPTRITSSTKSLIDVIVTNREYPEQKVKVIDLGLSDHLAQVIRINSEIGSNKTKIIVKRQFSNHRIDEFKNLLAQVSWDEVVMQSNVNASLEQFLQIFSHCFNTAFPYKRVKLTERINKKWLSKGLITSSNRMKVLNKLKRVYTLRREDLNYINAYQRIYKKILKEAKKRDNDRFVIESKDRTKAMWHLINKEIGKTHENDYKLELRIGNKITSCPTEITENLNKHFISTVEELIKQNNNINNYSNLDINYCPQTVFINPVTEGEVVKLAKNLKGKLTAGLDDIPENLVKHCILQIKKPLTHIYNASLNSGVFPDEWKIVKVKPLYKKGDRHDMNNYRPISVISVFAKLLERIMYNRLISFFHKHNILTEVQNGFRKGKCIETATQALIERIQEAIDKRMYSIGIFIDLSKAYDVLNHKLLLEKLSYYGVRGTTNSWFKSYLTNRKQSIEISQSDDQNVVVNRYRSVLMELKQGIPQGSVLGPLLFLLYINDLPLNINGANLVMFADDISILITDSDKGALQGNINRITSELELWFNKNNLVINTTKTGIMAFHNKQTVQKVKPKVIINKMNLHYTGETKFLGIHITESLQWNAHIKALACKLSKVAFMIKSLREILSTYMVRNFYFTKFQSLLRFGILLWGGVGGETNKKIFRLQKRVIRLMAGVNSRTSCRQLFKKLNILTLSSLYILEVTCFIRKHCQSLELNLNVHCHNTRRKTDIHKKSCRTNVYKTSVINMGTKIYNKLPDYMKEIDNYKSFRNKLKSFLFQHTFYSVEEFLSL